jgi:hypothetical protein
MADRPQGRAGQASFPNGKVQASPSSVLKAGLLPDGVPDPAEVAPLERPPDPLVHRQGRGPAAPRQLVRRDHHRGAAPAVVVVVPVQLPLARVVVPVLHPEDLLPVRYVHRQRPRRRGPAPVHRLLLPPRRRDRARPCGGLVQLGARWDGAVHAAGGRRAERAPDNIGLVELVRHAAAGAPRAPGRRREHPVRVLRGRRRPRAPCHAPPIDRCSVLPTS